MAKAEWPLNNGTIATIINFGVEVVFLIFTIAFFWLKKIAILFSLGNR